MQAIRCPSCGAILELDNNLLTAQCKFCGSIVTLSPADLGVDQTTAGVLAEMFHGDAAGVFLKKKLEALNMDEYWKHHAQTVQFVAEDDSVVEISYIDNSTVRNTTIFMGRKNVFLLFTDTKDAKRYIDITASVQLPPDDKYAMKQYLPEITHQFSLRDRRVLIVIARGKYEYPLVSFRGLPDVHAAWVISRLENLCCLLQYNHLTVSDIDIRDIYINPEMHQAYLYGGLWRAVRSSEVPSNTNFYKEELLGVRRIAVAAMGFSRIEDARSKLPEALYDFLNEQPKEDPFSDFSWWDVSLTLAYGKRVFQKMELNESTLY
jgi:hypothetical protein